MITIKGKDEAAIVARIERELKGEEVDIFLSDDIDFSLEQVLAFLGYNAKQTRVYIGRLERNSRKLEEDVRELNALLTPMSMFFARMIEDMYPDHMLPQSIRVNKERRERYELQKQHVEKERQNDGLGSGSPAEKFAEMKRIMKRLEDDGLVPKE